MGIVPAENLCVVLYVALMNPESLSLPWLAIPMVTDWICQQAKQVDLRGVG